jgi:hypothetical protein
MGVDYIGVDYMGVDHMGVPAKDSGPLQEDSVHFFANPHHDTDETQTYLGHHHRDKLVVIDHTVT